MKLSIIIPAHNPGRFLRETLDSCLCQQGINLEIVVVNDGSTDGTADYLAGLGSPVRVLSFPAGHGSGAFARNAGLEACSGDAVKFLDHDDVLVEGALEKEMGALEKTGADLVMSSWGVCEMDSDGVVDESTRVVHHPPAPDRLVDAILGEGKTPFTAAVLYRKDLIRDLRWDANVALYDDFDFFCRAALAAGKVAVAPGPSYWWRRHKGSFQARVAVDARSYYLAERTRSTICRKIEPALAARPDFTPARRRRLAAAYYKGLRAFARWDPAFCADILGRIEGLVPGFRPNATEEPVRVIRVLMRVLGVSPALAIYRNLRRCFRE